MRRRRSVDAASRRRPRIQVGCALLRVSYSVRFTMDDVSRSAQQALHHHYRSSRRHLPSPALAQATSILKMTQSYASFDLSDLAGSMPTSPSSNSTLRKLPVPKVGTKLGHRSHSDLMMADVADAMEEMDALIRPATNSPKLSSRKLPVPPVHPAVSQSRRFLPRPLSCDVPGPGDAEPVPSFLNATSRTALLLCRPYSFDYTCDDELDEAASMSCGASGSDPTIDQGKRKSTGITRQSSTTSCPALVRPCVSPRSPKYQMSPLNGGSSAGSGPNSLTNTPSPLPALAQDPAAFIPSGILVPLVPSPMTCSSPSTSTSPRQYYGSALSPNPAPVVIPSARSAFRAPHLQHRTTSLSLPTPNDGAGGVLAAARRQRFHLQPGISVHDAGYRVVQRPSRSRQTTRPR